MIDKEVKTVAMESDCWAVFLQASIAIPKVMAGARRAGALP
jgi:hypothetical protein